MGKKGYNPFEKQSSTISANTALKTLLAHGFEIARVSQIEHIGNMRVVDRPNVKKARAQLGVDAEISRTGLSFFVIGFNAVSNVQVKVDLPIKGMLGLGALKAIQDKTGIELKNE
jgi:hypothetical protein